MPAGSRVRRWRSRRRLVDGLVDLHAVDASVPELAGFGRAEGYLARQLKRFGGLYETNATRPLPDLEAVADWLAANLPESPPSTVVHGDYRIGNVMMAPSPTRLAAILDWEMATIGDPLADLGYMTTMWSEPGDPPNAVSDLSSVTREAGFPAPRLPHRPLRRAHRPLRRRPPLVPDPRHLEGGDLPRGQLRPLQRRHHRRPLLRQPRARRPRPRGTGLGAHPRPLTSPGQPSRFRGRSSRSPVQLTRS